MGKKKKARKHEYPSGAYAPTGELWWRLRLSPGSHRRFGDEQKIAAWLAFEIGRGGIFTMKSLRLALGEGDSPNTAEHLNRRLRTLRIRDGWQIPSAKDDATLAHDEYRVDVIGWHPGLGTDRPSSYVVSNKIRRQVFERDRHMCTICGALAGEPYGDMPEIRARLTLGHRIPGRRLTTAATVDELRAECSRCNETVRDEMFDPVTLPELLPTIRNLSRPDKEHLLTWLEDGRRPRSRVEVAYADARRLSQGELEALLSTLRKMARSEGAFRR